MNKKIIIATKNKGKLAEIESVFASCGLGFNVDILPENYADIVEDGNSFEENALIKARFVCQDTGEAALADDSGLSVFALEGEPGIYSARYADDYTALVNDEGKNHIETQDEKNIRKLLERARDLKEEERGCAFHCAMALVFPKDTFPPLFAGKEIVVHETWEGLLTKTPIGENGFGYDPIFYDLKAQCTAAQMLKKIKMTRSHRAKALRALIMAIQSVR